jgi:hypothetical protein
VLNWEMDAAEFEASALMADIPSATLWFNDGINISAAIMKTDRNNNSRFLLTGDAWIFFDCFFVCSVM